jgi:hypothetical protein
MDQTWNHHATTGRICNRINEKRDTCGACGKRGKPGDKLHCFSHWLEFILADQEGRLQQVRRYDNCTNCLGRNQNTAYHKDTNPGQKPLVCGLYDKASRSYCNSLEHAAFHGSTSDKQDTQTRNTIEKEEHRNSSNQMENDRPRSIKLEEQLKECVKHRRVEGTSSKLGTDKLCHHCVWKLRMSSYPRREDHLSQVQDHPEGEGVPRCYRFNDTHPHGHHTRSYVDSKKTSLHPDSDQASLVHDAQSCRRCKTCDRTPRWCGACWMLAEPGEALHCLNHCIQFTMYH